MLKKRILLITVVILCIFTFSSFTACKGLTLKLPNMQGSSKSNQSHSTGALQRQVAGVGLVTLELTYPVGQSPRVFTKGWVFGAKAIINPGKPDQKDISNLVKWSGSGSFEPSIGALSRPSFSGEGSNTITLSVSEGDQNLSTQYTFLVVSPDNYAHVGTGVYGTCAHGCLSCPHQMLGTIQMGSPNVIVAGQRAARVGDTGKCFTCCGPNTYELIEGDANVLIDGKPAARIGDRIKTCGGDGFIGSSVTKGQERILIVTPFDVVKAVDAVPFDIKVEFPLKGRTAIVKFSDDNSELKLEAKNTSFTHVFKAGTWTIRAVLVDENGASISEAEISRLIVLGPADCNIKIKPEIVNGEPGNYTFTVSGENLNNKLLRWEIDGKHRMYDSVGAFSADFNSIGQSKVSVVEVVDANEVCRATALVTINPPASQSTSSVPPLQVNNQTPGYVPPLMVNNQTQPSTTPQNQGTGWYLDGSPTVYRIPPAPDDCNYFGKMLTIVPGEATGVQSWKDCSGQSKCSGSYSGFVTWTTPPSFMQPGSKVTFTMSERTTSQNTCGYRNLGSSGGLKVDGALIMEVMEYTRTPTQTVTYTVKTGSPGAKLVIVVDVQAASLKGTVTYNYTYK